MTRDSAAERMWIDGAPVRQLKVMLGQAETGGVNFRS